MCGHWWHIRYRSLLAILRKKVGELKEEIRNLYRFHVNSYNLWICIFFEFIHVNSYNLWILIIQIIFSSILHKGYFHGHGTRPLHGRTCSAIDEQTENESRKTPPTTNRMWDGEEGSEVKSENLNTTYAKSYLHRGMWNGQQYGRTLRMLMCSVILSHNNIVKLPLTWMRSMV